MGNIFSETEVLTMPRSFQKYSWNLLSSMDYGKLYPLFVMDCIPGDTIRISGNINVRARPMVFPNLTPNNLTMHFFFVPYRLLDDNFTEGVTGTTEDGDAVNYDFPKWNVEPTAPKIKTLWDYFGLPVNIKINNDGVIVEDNTNVSGIEPTRYLKRAYNKIFNDMYRNENFTEKVDLDSEDIQYRCWRADYFTKSLPWQQKPSESNYFALPVNTQITGSGQNPVGFKFDDTEFKQLKIFAAPENENNDVFTTLNNGNVAIGSVPFETATGTETIPLSAQIDGSTFQAISTAFDISDLRLAGQMQKWAERNARGGTRYDEMIRAHFGITPRDARLQLPEFIGGFKFPILCGENYSTVETASHAQGTRAGIGNGIGGNKIRKYFVEEYGIIMGIGSILPQAQYQQGMPREWIKHNQLDFFHHELCCLSEREVYQGELVCSNDAEDNITETGKNLTQLYNKNTFGFQGMYNEYRYHPNVVTGEARIGELACWHQSRLMDPSYTTDAGKVVPSTVLGEDFVEAKDVRKTCFADLKNTDPFIIQGHFGIKAFRLMTYKAEPGLFDHF